MKSIIIVGIYLNVVYFINLSPGANGWDSLTPFLTYSWGRQAGDNKPLRQSVIQNICYCGLTLAGDDDPEHS